jgi:hypothetical protein
MSPPTRTRRELLGAVGTTVFAALTAGQPVAASETAPTFVVQAFEPIGIEVDRGESFDASATILNAGRPGTETVEYRIEDETVRSREITLDRSEQRQITFEGIETASLEPGELEHGVYAAGYSRRGSIVISGTPAFEVSEVRPRLGDTEVGSKFSVTATITNTGEGDGEQTVAVLIDGEPQDSETVSLDIGESQSVTFTIDSPDTTGEYTHTVRTADAEASGAISVVEQDSGADGESSQELLFALGGAGSIVALYGGYRLFARRRDRTGVGGSVTADAIDDEGATSPDGGGPNQIGDAGQTQTGGSDSPPSGTGRGSTAIESAIDDNLDSAASAVSGARRHRSDGEYARALAACYRARTALDDAAEAASEYEPERVAEIDSQIETVDDLAAAIEAELDD